MKFPETQGRRQATNRRLTQGTGGGRQAIVAPVQRPSTPVQVAAVENEKPPGWSMAGAVAVVADADAPRYLVLVGGRIDELYATLANAGSSSTVMTAYKNGASIGTVTLASSDTYELDAITPVFVIPGDVLHMRPTTAGTGAKGLHGNFVIKR